MRILWNAESEKNVVEILGKSKKKKSKSMIKFWLFELFYGKFWKDYPKFYDNFQNLGKLFWNFSIKTLQMLSEMLNLRKWRRNFGKDLEVSNLVF